MLVGELYQLFHTEEIRMRGWFFFSDVEQDIEWYLKDTGEKISLIALLAVFYLREKQGLFKHVLFAFLFYRACDLIFYWSNFSKTTWQYATIYLMMGFYITRHSLIFYYKSKCKHK